MLRTRILSSLVLALGLLGSQSAYAWWNDGWAFRKELTFNLTPAGADVASNVQDVPVLVRLSHGNFTNNVTVGRVYGLNYFVHAVNVGEISEGQVCAAVFARSALNTCLP